MKREIWRILGKLISWLREQPGDLISMIKDPEMKFNRRNRQTQSSSGLTRPHLNWNSAIKTMIADDEQKTEAILSNISKRGFQTRKGVCSSTLADSINRDLFSTLLITQWITAASKKKRKKKKKNEPRTRWYASQQFHLGFSHSGRGKRQTLIS